MRIETTRIISAEIANQMSRKLNEVKSSLNAQIQDAISTAISEKMLSTIQKTISMQGRTNFTVLDRKSSGLQRCPGAVNPHKTWENHLKMGFTRETKKRVGGKTEFSRFLYKRTKLRQWY